MHSPNPPAPLVRGVVRGLRGSSPLVFPPNSPGPGKGFPLIRGVKGVGTATPLSTSLSGFPLIRGTKGVGPATPLSTSLSGFPLIRGTKGVKGT